MIKQVKGDRIPNRHQQLPRIQIFYNLSYDLIEMTCKQIESVINFAEHNPERYLAKLNLYHSQPSGVSRTKNVLLAANAAGAVQHWHMTSGKCLHTYEDAGNQVYAVDYSPDGSQFCTGGRDCAIRIYDEATKAETHCMKGINDAFKIKYFN
jgi:WD40 repeat protein